MIDYALFSPIKINAVFPASYFSEGGVSNLIENYSEEALDGTRVVPTLFCRQDTSDVNSRRAAGLSSESPTPLIDGRLLISGIYPSLKILEAINSGDLNDIELIDDEDLADFVETNKIPDPEV